MKERILQISFLLILCFNSFDTQTDINSYKKIISNFLKEYLKAIEVDFFIDEIRKTKISENDSKELVNNIRNIVERYVYFDIIKNPPQPKENYFNVVDLVEKLKNVNTEERPIYDLIRDINLIISECQDNHFFFGYNKEIFQGYKLYEMFFLPPIHY